MPFGAPEHPDFPAGLHAVTSEVTSYEIQFGNHVVANEEDNTAVGGVDAAVPRGAGSRVPLAQHPCVRQVGDVLVVTVDDHDRLEPLLGLPVESTKRSAQYVP